jgi:hypothetical protein
MRDPAVVDSPDSGRSGLATAFTRSPARQELRLPSRQIKPNPLQVSTNLELRFALSISEPWEGTGRIVWTRRPDEKHPYPVGMPVSNSSIPPDARLAIAAFVAKPLATPAPSRESKYVASCVSWCSSTRRHAGPVPPRVSGHPPSRDGAGGSGDGDLPPRPTRRLRHPRRHPAGRQET